MATPENSGAGGGANPWWVWWNVQSGQPAQVIQEPTAAAVQAKTGFPPLAGPFTTKAKAQAWITSGPGQKTVSHNPASALTSGLSGLTASFTGFFAKLTSGNLWLRIGEVLLGIVLLAIGVARITSAVPIATKIAKTAGATALVA